MRYKANKLEDVQTLADRLMGLDENKRDFILANTLYVGMMRWGELEPYFNLLRASGIEAFYIFINMMRLNQPEQVKDIWAQTMEHMLMGKDQEDADSVGGFSQAEINEIVRWLEQIPADA